MTSPWSIVNEIIIECLSKPEADKRITCLEGLLELSNHDGMVLYRLAEQYENQGEPSKALEYYIAAYKKFPLANWKSKALKRAQALEHQLDHIIDRYVTWNEVRIDDDTLFIVNCTKTKAWKKCDATPQELPATLAYQGSSYHRFLLRIRALEKLHDRTIPWLILSAKHGFLHPCDTIENYNITFNDPQAITLQQLEEQARTLTINGKPLTAYKHIYVYTNNPTYHHVACQALKQATTCKRIIDT